MPPAVVSSPARATLRLAGLAGLGAAALAPGTAQAQTFQQDMTTQLVIPGRCAVNAATLDFGTALPTATGPIDSQTNLVITCSKATNYSISLDAGDSANGAQRRMRNGTAFLPYNLYTNAARTTLWTTASRPGAYGQANKGPMNIPLYGRVPAFAAGSLAAGTYRDTVTITIMF